MLIVTRRTSEATFRRETFRPSERPQFQLNRALDREALATAFRRKGRVQVPAILRREDAQALYRCLAQRTHWGLMLKSGPGIGLLYASPEQCRFFTDVQYCALRKMVAPFKHRAGSLLMGVRLIGHDAFERERDPSLLARFAEWLDSKGFLGFVRNLAGESDLQCGTTQALRFTTGHFSSFHTDAENSDRRCVTCVFSLSPTWQRSWGGLLQFDSQSGNAHDVFVPHFNSVTIFDSSFRHGVSVVTRQAQKPRYSIAARFLTE